MYLIALILPPLALALLGKHLAALVSLCVTGATFVFLIELSKLLLSDGGGWMLAFISNGSLVVLIVNLLSILLMIFMPWILCIGYAVSVVRQVKAGKRNLAQLDGITGPDGQGG